VEISDRACKSKQSQGVFLAGIASKVRTIYVQNVNLDAAAQIKLSNRPGREPESKIEPARLQIEYLQVTGQARGSYSQSDPSNE
jgi:hypothetical protein